MSLVRRVGISALRNFRPRAAGSKGSFFGPGTQEKADGILFGETPPLPGQKRRMEDWEPAWCETLSMHFACCEVIFCSRFSGSPLCHCWAIP
jgi:hypothetical protein